MKAKFNTGDYVTNQMIVNSNPTKVAEVSFLEWQKAFYYKVEGSEDWINEAHIGLVMTAKELNELKR